MTATAASISEIRAALTCTRSGCSCTRNGNVHCPAHEDDTPSFSVRRGERVAVVVRCYSGCTQDEVTAALRDRGLWGSGVEYSVTMADTNGNGANAPSRQVRRAEERAEAKAQRRIVATYDYTDEDGALLFQAVRYEPKDFRQRRPNGGGRWIWNLENTRLVLFNLPEVIAAVARGERIFIVEGEKDVLAIKAAGGVATCNPMGAGKWRAEYSETLRGADVVFVVDRDEAGKKHLAAALPSIRAVAASVTVVEAAEGKDAADHLAAGYGLDDFIPIDVEAEVEEFSGPHPLDWAEFWATDQREEDWLLEPLLPRARSIALYSPAKGGKSLLALDIVARIATGQRVLDQAAGEPIDVSYFDLEMTATDLYERLVDLGYGPESDLSHLHYYSLPSLPPADTAAGGEVIEACVSRDGSLLAVFDTMSRVMSGGENDADTLRAFYAHTGLRLKAAGVTVLRLDHAGKDIDKGQRGSSAKNDDVDLVWRLDPRDGGLRLHATHRRQSWVPDYLDLVRFTDPLRHERTTTTVPPGTHELVAQLDALEVPLDHGQKRIRVLLKDHHIKASSEVISAAIRTRKQRLNPSGIPSRIPSTSTYPGDEADTPQIRFTDTPPDTSGYPAAASGGNSVSLETDTPAEPQPRREAQGWS